MNDTATGILDPGVDRKGTVEKRKAVEVVFHLVAPGREIMKPGGSPHRAVAVEHRGAAELITSQPNATLVSGSFTWN